MSRQHATTPLLEPIDGPVLVALGNWLADSLDVSELTTEQALLLSVFADRLTIALVREFRLPMLLTTLRSLEQQDADEPSEESDD